MHSLGSGELVFYRGVVGVIVMGAWMRSQGVAIKSSVPWMHVGRSLAGVISLSAWFYALSTLPLATAMTLNYTSSLWIAAAVLIGAFLWGAKEQAATHGLQTGLLVTVAAGFAGVLLVLRPAIHQGQVLEGLIGLASGLIAAFAYMQVGKLTRHGEPESRIVFYFAIRIHVGREGAIKRTRDMTCHGVEWFDFALVSWGCPCIDDGSFD
jgi:S-adenosylmethionine uptake transporter